jgi:hypothetical protein
VSTVAFGARVLLVLVLAVSVAGKLRAYGAYVRSLDGFPWVPRRWAREVAAAVVAAEATVAVLLALPATARVGALLAVGLLVVLTAAVWAAVRRGTGAVCRCFGTREEPLSRRQVARDLTLVAVALLAVPGGPVTSAGAVLAEATAAVLTLFVLRFEDLVDLFEPVGR